MTPTRVALSKSPGGGSAITIQGNIEIEDVPKLGYAIIQDATISLPGGDIRGKAYGWWGSFEGTGNLNSVAYAGTYRFGPVSISVPLAPPRTPDLTKLCAQNSMVCK